MLIIDIRSAIAFQAGHIPHAVSIPANRLRMQSAQLKSVANIIIYGQADDAELAMAERHLSELGLREKSATFTEGWAEWNNCGLPTE